MTIKSSSGFFQKQPPPPNDGVDYVTQAEYDELLAEIEAGSLTGPQGVQGPQGPQGPQGETGATGGTGPAGPASVVGTAKGTWNASTNTPALSSGSGTQGDAYVVSVAGSTSIDGISTWAVGDVALRGDTAWGRVPASSSGAFTEISLPRASITTPGTTGGLLISDPYGEAIFQISSATITVPGMTFGLTGPYAPVLGAGDFTATTVEADSSTIGGMTTTSSGVGQSGLDGADPYGEVFYRLRPDYSQAFGMTTSRPGTAAGMMFVDPYGEAFARFSPTGAYAVSGLSVDKTAGGGVMLADPYGEVFAMWDMAGEGSGGSSGGGGSGDSATTHSDAEISGRNGENLGDAALTMTLPIGRVSAIHHGDYALIPIYGQSLSVGAEGTPTLSTSQPFGNLMLGTKTSSVSNGLPGANNATPPTYQVTGASTFNALVATAGVSAETVAHGMTNTLSSLWNRDVGQEDASGYQERLVAAAAGVGGLGIAALSKGASPNLFNRVPSLIAQSVAAATTAGKTLTVPAIVWMQGEADQATTKGVYKPLFQTLVTDLQDAAKTSTGQTLPPLILTYQTTAPNWNFDNAGLGVQMAQLEVALENPSVIMVGPIYQYPDSNNLHLPANSYRWFGSMIGKVLKKTTVDRKKWKPLHIRRATLRGREILVDFYVPHPPLVFDKPWLQDGWYPTNATTGGTNEQVDQPDKGFTITTTIGGTLAISTVELVSETQVKITLVDVPDISLEPVLRYADGAHYGNGSIRDSDPEVAYDSWLDGIGGQANADINPTLSGKPYPLFNWAVAQQINIERL